MALISFQEYMAVARESRSITRSKSAAARGLGPKISDVFGHSTPSPWEVEKLLKIKRTNSPNEPPKAPFKEGKEMRPNYSFDRLVRKAAAASQEVDSELDKAQKDADRIDKEKAKKDKKPKFPSTKPEVPKPDKEGDDRDDEGDTKPDVSNKKTPPPIKKPPLIKPEPTQIKNDKEEKLKEEAEWLSLLGNTSFDRR
jgi:hypothetical protein